MRSNHHINWHYVVLAYEQSRQRRLGYCTRFTPLRYRFKTKQPITTTNHHHHLHAAHTGQKHHQFKIKVHYYYHVAHNTNMLHTHNNINTSS